MNLIYGKVLEAYERDGQRWGRLSIKGAIKVVTLDLLADAGTGDEVLVCDGVAIGKVRDAADPLQTHVSRDPRQAD
jgi:hydrogenase maturation factor